MTNNNTSGRVPQKTIDSGGNIVDKPYGPSRWASPKRYACGHEDCPNPALVTSTIGGAHNCCTTHEEGVQND